MMNQQDIFRKIGNILTELNEQYQFLAQNPEKLNELELELFLANSDFLSDHVRIIKKLNSLSEEKHTTETDTNLLLQEQNTIILPEQSYNEEPKSSEIVLEDIAEAEEQEERVDVIPEEERVENEIIYEETAEKILEKDFFKPDQESNTFEFVLGTHSNEDKFDYEENSVDEIFDRPLSKAEEEILAQKKRIHEKEQAPVKDEPATTDEDEIGPEPFLIPHEQEHATNHPEAETLFEQQESKTIESLKNIDFDDEIISPPVVVDERPAFTPYAVPVKPTAQPISSNPAPSLNDLLAKTNSFSNESVKAPISDLKQAISLNEKLLFIKDLFSGYNMAYSEALDIVNKMPNFESADSFLQNNYAVKNNWAAKQSVVDQFYELLNRRFRVKD